jgi:hypothetical protein
LNFGSLHLYDEVGLPLRSPNSVVAYGVTPPSVKAILGLEIEASAKLVHQVLEHEATIVERVIKAMPGVF